MKHPLALVSFYTEGPPIDNGEALGNCKEKIENAAKPYVDYCKVYSLQELIKEDPWWQTYYRDYSNVDNMNLPTNPGANVIGYFKYKPLIIYRMMQKLPENAIIYYMDGNVNKTPSYIENFDQLRDMCNYVLDKNETDIWIGNDDPEFLLRAFTKSYTIYKMALPWVPLEKYFDAPLLLGCRMVVRNTPKMRQWMEEILTLMESDDLLAPTPEENRHPKYQFHTGDQGLLGMFFYNKKFQGELPKEWPRFWFQHRRFDMEHIREQMIQEHL
jgi:hypothetical protein